jgi:hypothetical protein
MEIRVNLPMNCKSQHLIYCVICPTCKNFTWDRNKSNAQQIKDQSFHNTSCCGHSAYCGNGNFILFPFYKLPNDDENIQLAKDNYFIRLLYFDVLLNIDAGGKLTTQLYDKREDFNFANVNFLYTCSNIPLAFAYGIYISHLIRYARSWSTCDQFLSRGNLLTDKLM